MVYWKAVIMDRKGISIIVTYRKLDSGPVVSEKKLEM
jgi:hypothetical protein